MKQSPFLPQPNPVTLEAIRSPNGYHAFLVATIELKDPGKGRLVNLKFADGTVFQALVASDVLRLGNLNGDWRATLHFTTNPNGVLEPPLRLQRLRPRETQIESLSSFWSMAGDVENLDPMNSRVSLRILTSRRHPTFFVNTIQLSKELFKIVQANPVRTWLMQGFLEQGTLIAQSVSIIKIRVPRKSNLNSQMQEETKHHG
jgi:hypothetical protein